MLANCGSNAVVEHLTNDPKFQGSNPAATSAGGDKIARKMWKVEKCEKFGYLPRVIVII